MSTVSFKNFKINEDVIKELSVEGHHNIIMKQNVSSALRHSDLNKKFFIKLLKHLETDKLIAINKNYDGSRLEYWSFDLINRRSLDSFTLEQFCEAVGITDSINVIDNTDRLAWGSLYNIDQLDDIHMFHALSYLGFTDLMTIELIRFLNERSTKFEYIWLKNSQNSNIIVIERIEKSNLDGIIGNI